ncbi:MAG: hypothetical protein KIS92_00090 [Planctomycetota bacterium]|nr:hypothetical protein [Planctomycetota bacterium]
MTPGQRRTLWACTFAMSFIFFYEARGVPLIWRENAPRLPTSAAARAFFWEELAWGSAFLVFCAVLTTLLRKPYREPEGGAPRGPNFLLGDWIGLAIALGVLAGTAWQSYHGVMGP